LYASAFRLHLNYFKTDREESCTAQLNLRVPPSLLEKIKEQENWQEFVRTALAEKLAINSSQVVIHQ
jgi:hypothetical protein